MKNVKQILDGKGNEVWTVLPQQSVLDAISLMAEKGIGAVVVVEDGDAVGILSERDYARNVILQGRSSGDTAVSQIMSSPVITTDLACSAEECMKVMTDKHIRHLPVVDNGQLVGVISIGDLVKSIIDHQQFMIEQLENYITS